MGYEVRQATVDIGRHIGQSRAYLPVVDVLEVVGGEGLTAAFRRAAVAAGWTPGLVLEELPVLQQRPHLVFLEERRG